MQINIQANGEPNKKQLSRTSISRLEHCLEEISFISNSICHKFINVHNNTITDQQFFTVNVLKMVKLLHNTALIAMENSEGVEKKYKQIISNLCILEDSLIIEEPVLEIGDTGFKKPLENEDMEVLSDIDLKSESILDDSSFINFEKKGESLIKASEKPEICGNETEKEERKLSEMVNEEKDSFVDLLSDDDDNNSSYDEKAYSADLEEDEMKENTEENIIEEKLKKEKMALSDEEEMMIVEKPIFEFPSLLNYEMEEENCYEKKFTNNGVLIESAVFKNFKAFDFIKEGKGQCQIAFGKTPGNYALCSNRLLVFEKNKIVVKSKCNFFSLKKKFFSLKFFL